MKAYYNYDDAGERNLKLTGVRALAIQNGNVININSIREQTLYASSLVTVNDKGYTKHYFEEGKRICSKIGNGKLTNVGSSVTPIEGTYANRLKYIKEEINKSFDMCASDNQKTDFANKDLYTKVIYPNTQQVSASEPAFYYHTDHLGSASYITDSSGQKTQTLAYLPYGEDWVDLKNNSPSYTTPYKFNGKEKDPETGYNYFGARYYTDWASIWLSVDPLSDKYPHLTSYNYCANNPVMLIDPDGRSYGDYYDGNGNWLANDGIDDNKVYHADENGDITYGVGILKETKFKEWSYSIKDSKFQEYFPTLLNHEGGFVDNKNDKGGATNKGITLNTFIKYSKDLLNVQPTLDNLKRITDDQAAAIYEVGYWNPSGAGNISDKQLGWLHFDTYLHGGASSVLGNTIKAYGGNGRSINMINSILETNPAINVFNTYKQERLNRFDRIIDSNPKFETFRKGWTNRVNSFKYQTQ